MLILVYYYIYTVMLSVSVVETPGRQRRTRLLLSDKGDRLRWKRTISIIRSPSCKNRVLNIGFFVLSRLLLVFLAKSTLPDRGKLII